MRALNLFAPPFNLPLPLCQHEDVFDMDLLMLWEIENIDTAVRTYGPTAMVAAIHDNVTVNRDVTS